MTESSAGAWPGRARVTARLARRRERWGAILGRLESTSRGIAIVRLLAAVVFVALTVTGMRDATARRWAWWGTAVAGTAFAVGIVLHRRAHRRRDVVRGLVGAIDRDRLRLADRWRELPASGERFEGSALAADLALFGRGSLFQMISRCATPFGEERLARDLDGGRPAERWADRQALVRELVQRPGFRQRLEATGKAVADPQSAELLEHLRAPSIHDRHRWLGPAAIGLAALTVAQGLAGWLLSVPTAFWPFLAAQAIVAAVLARRLTGEYAPLLAREGDLASWSLALAGLERARFRARLGRDLRDAIAGPPMASRSLARVASLVDLLALQRSALYWPVNALLLWDVWLTWRLAACRRAMAPRLDGWVAALGEMEALGSLAGHAATFDAPVFPVLREGVPAWEGTAVVHALVPPARAIGNDVLLDHAGSLLLLTGSNMSGKSTLLRAIGLDTVLALAGGAVHARSLTLAPCRLMTSIRVVDALDEGVSSFYAEVRRLRAILEAITDAGAAADAPAVLYLIDEILRGTNTRERLIASTSIVGKLAAGRAFGVVTSHDLSLTELEGAIPGLVNAHFREEITEGRMTFDYTLRPGPVPTTNALAILRLEGIDV